MVHKPYKRIVPGADTAFLFIHGIVGTPNHFLPLVSCLPESVSVSGILLPGHGEDALSFSQNGMKNWRAHVEMELEQLCRDHKKIYIVGHSMGTLFAIEQALNNRRIAGMFLLAVPLYPTITLRNSTNAIRLFLGKIREDRPAEVNARESCSITLERNLLHYYGWPLRYLELFGLMQRVRRRLPQLQTPATVFQSGRDEMVAPLSWKLLKKNQNLKCHCLSNAWHSYYPQAERTLLYGGFVRWLQEIGIEKKHISIYNIQK